MVACKLVGEARNHTSEMRLTWFSVLSVTLTEWVGVCAAISHHMAPDQSSCACTQPTRKDNHSAFSHSAVYLVYTYQLLSASVTVKMSLCRIRLPFVKMGSSVLVGAHKVHVRATAGVESSCYVESVDVAFDIGCCHGRIASKAHVFITHGHVDHIAGFVAHAARRSLQRMAPAKYYVPPHLVPHMQRIIESFAAMQEDLIPATIIPLEPFQDIHIDSKWMVKAFPTCHRVRSLGYILYAKRNKLREDLIGRASKEIAALRKAGETITLIELSPEIAYTGDTTIELFLSAEERGIADILRVKALVTEATYLDASKSEDEATARGHIHLSQIVRNELLFSEIQSLVLVHSSARYTPEEVKSLVKEQLPQSLRVKTIVAGR